MSTVSSTNTTQHTAAPPKGRTIAQNIGLILAFIVLGVILLLPTPETLSTGGHRMIGVLAFAIILWMTSAVSLSLIHIYTFLSAIASRIV